MLRITCRLATLVRGGFGLLDRSANAVTCGRRGSVGPGLAGRHGRARESAAAACWGRVTRGPQPRRLAPGDLRRGRARVWEVSSGRLVGTPRHGDGKAV